MKKVLFAIMFCCLFLSACDQESEQKTVNKIKSTGSKSGSTSNRKIITKKKNTVNDTRREAMDKARLSRSA